MSVIAMLCHCWDDQVAARLVQYFYFLGMTLNCIHIFFVTCSFLYWCVMRPVSQRFLIHCSIYVLILIISYLATFLGTNSLYVLMCRKAVIQTLQNFTTGYPNLKRINRVIQLALSTSQVFRSQVILRHFHQITRFNSDKRTVTWTNEARLLSTCYVHRHHKPLLNMYFVCAAFALPDIAATWSSHLRYGRS